MSKKDRDLAIQRVGKALFGEYWIGAVSKAEWEGARRAPHLAGDGSAAQKLAKALHRWNALGWQMDEVMQWLPRRGIELIPSEFDQAKFESFFAAEFPGEDSPTAARIAAVKRRLNKGERPGRGGSVRWKSFCDAIRTDTKSRWDDRTIQTDARRMLPKSRNRKFGK